VPNEFSVKYAVPKINQEINEPSYEMVGVKITVTNYGQNNRIFGFSVKYSNLTKLARPPQNQIISENYLPI
jgi:hypothetical protein